MIIKPLTDHRWKGYTLDELQEQIVVNETMIMVQTQRLGKAAKKLKPGYSEDSNDNRLMTTIMNYANYLVMLIMLIRKIRPLIASLRKSKKAAV